ncbi:hypothetical protein PMAYCL1PPCAC_26526, partial [Pristionchus mayeri]
FIQLFGTSNVALLSHHNCARFTETGTGKTDRTCLNGLSDAYDLEKLDTQCQNVKPDTLRYHLVRDVHLKHAPRIILVYLNNVTFEVHYGVENVSLSAGVHNKWSLPETLKQTSHVGYHLQKYESLEESIFDTHSNLLYLIIKTSSRSRKVRVVYVRNVFYVNFKFEEFDRE